MGLSSERPIFVCGVPKSGTTLVGRLLANHTDCRTDYDIDPSIRFLRYVRDTMDDYFFFSEPENSPMAAANEYWIKDDFRTWHLMNIEYYQQFHKSYRTGAPRWGSSSCYSHYHRKILWKWFPEAIFLIVRRDPRDHWCSFKHLYVNFEVDQWDWFVESRGRLPTVGEDERIQFVEYHEVVRDPTVIFDTLGLSVPENYLTGVRDVFLHRTRGSKVADWIGNVRSGEQLITSSIGRWKRDLSEEEIQRCVDTFPEECEYYDGLDGTDR